MQGGTTSGIPGSHVDEATSPRLEGYAAVAAWIALDPDNETFVFRKFDGLAARNIFYIQDELLCIEKELATLDRQDAEAAREDMDVKDAARTWEVLNRRSDAGHEYSWRRVELIKRLRIKIKEYHETLLLQKQIVELQRPNRRVFEALRYWFREPRVKLGGLSKNYLNDENDLVALKATIELNYLSQWLRRHWPAKNEPTRGGSFGIGRFEEHAVSIAVSVISIAVAAFLLIGSITSFYLVSSATAKLVMIALFTAAFALSVGLMTNARRAEIFAGTAAYAAVLVVFVSGNISSS